MPLRHDPVTLTPPQFGKPDPKLARMVMDNIAGCMPPTVIPWQRATMHAGKLRNWLQSHGMYEAKNCDLDRLLAQRITPEEKDDD